MRPGLQGVGIAAAGVVLGFCGTAAQDRHEGSRERDLTTLVAALDDDLTVPIREAKTYLNGPANDVGPVIAGLAAFADAVDALVARGDAPSGTRRFARRALEIVADLERFATSG